MAINYSLDMRCQNILQMIINTQGYVAISEVAKESNVSKRSIYYDISKINEWLSSFGISEVEFERNKGIFINPEHAKQIKKVLKESIDDIEYLFTPTQRMQIIVCSLITKSTKLYIEDFMTLCKVSRNTVINDLKVVTTNLETYNLSLHYINKSGYRIVGDFINRVSLFFLYFNDLSEYYRKGIIFLENRDKINKIDENLNRIEKDLDTKYVSGVLFAIATFFASINAQSQRPTFSECDCKDIMGTNEYQLVTMYFSKLQEEYKLYMTLHLLGSRLQTVSINLMADNDSETYALAQVIVEEFSNVACIEFTNKEAVIAALFAHLKTSLYRYKYGVQLANPMLIDIKHEYKELFELTKKACNVLEKQLGVPVPDSEIAYITLHFGGFIVDSKESKQELRILIICPNGVSTGNMLKAEIRALIPHASTIDNIMVSEFSVDHHYDVIISTVEIAEGADVLVVHPILTDNDRVTILRRCMKNMQNNNTEINGIMKVAKKYIIENELAAFKKDLEAHFGSLSILNTSPKKNFGLGMLSHLPIENIMICDTDYNWQEAIIFASVPLLDKRNIEERYVENIVKKCNEMGPYMFISDTVVLAHAGVDDGVRELGISFAKFNKPIRFNEHRKANIIMVLSATDQVSHIRILNDIMIIFSDEKNINKLLKQNNAEDILADIRVMLTKKKEQ